MCGIVGIIAKYNGFYVEHDDIFEEMLYLDGVRGMDSTGVFTVNHRNEVDMVKQAVNPGIFFQTESWRTIKKQINNKAHIVIGHNRKATTGSIISKNAHPFAKEHIVLVHNGYISNHKNLDDGVEVDSEAIVSVLLKENNPIEGLKQLFGAYAIVWYNKKTKKLFMARNKERTLAMAQSDNHIIIASERQMLNWVLERNRLNQYKLAQELKEDVLYEFSLRPFSMKETGIPAPAPLVFRNQRSYADRHPAVFMDYPVGPGTNQKEYPEGDQSCTSVFNDEEFNEQDALMLERIQRDAAEPEDLTLWKPPGAKEAGEVNTEALERKVAALRKLYPFGSQVLFYPRNVQEDGPKNERYIRVRGVMWVPGKTAWDAVIIVMKKHDPEHYLDPEVPLLGCIQSMSRKNRDIYFNLEWIRPADSMVTSANGTKLGGDEWKMICNKLVCATCGHAPKEGSAKKTEVIRRQNGVYEITCEGCFDEVYKGKPSVKPDDKQDKPTVNP